LSHLLESDRAILFPDKANDIVDLAVAADDILAVQSTSTDFHQNQQL